MSVTASGSDRAEADVVAVEGDVERARRGRRRRRSARWPSAERARPATRRRVCSPTSDHAVEAVVALDDLVGHPPDGPAHVVGVHDLAPGNENAPEGASCVRSRSAISRVLPAVRASRDPLHGQGWTIARARPTVADPPS